MIDVHSARRQMIEQQVRAWDVLDLRVLDAMARVPREAFVPFRPVFVFEKLIGCLHGLHFREPEFLHKPVLIGLKTSLDATLRLGRVGRDPANSQLS